MQASLDEHIRCTLAIVKTGPRLKWHLLFNELSAGERLINHGIQASGRIASEGFAWGSATSHP